jgi:ATP-dependent HslUV protease subunit HslV
MRAAVELAKDWRTDKALRQLEALLIVASDKQLLTISGTGDVMEPEDNVSAIGSGGGYALAAAKALLADAPTLSAREIAEKSIKIASELCIYTNDSIVIEEIT